MTEQETDVPFYGPTEQWYDELVAFSLNYLESIRLNHVGVSENARRKTKNEAAKRPQYSVFPPEMIAELEARTSPEEIFTFLTNRIPEEFAGRFAGGNLASIIESATRLGQDMQPLVMMALVYSIHEVVPGLVWMGSRIANVVREYVQALQDIYRAETGNWVNAELLREAKIHRDEIEFFCFGLFGHELTQIRMYLARLAPERFLYRWEELDENGNIVMKKSMGGQAAEVAEEHQPDPEPSTERH